MIREETRAGARVLTLARPEKRNAISSAMVDGLVDALDRARGDDVVRGIVLAADGNVWAAGADLAELGQILDRPDGADHVVAMGRRMAAAIERAEVPVVAAVTGHVYGGGCELLLLTDEAIVEEQVTIAFRHARMGLCPAWGGSARLVERVGPQAASRLLTSAATVGAREAASLGLVGAVSATGHAVADAVARVDALSLLDKGAVTAQRKCLLAAREAARGDADAREAAVFKRMWGGPAHRAAMARFAAGSPRGE